MPYNPIIDADMSRLLEEARALPPGVERVRAYQRIEDRILANASSATADEGDAGTRPPVMAVEAITLRNEIREGLKRDLLGNAPPLVSFWIIATGCLVAVIVTLWIALHLFWALGFNHLLTGR